MTETKMPETTYASTLHGDVVRYSTLIADNEIESNLGRFIDELKAAGLD